MPKGRTSSCKRLTWKFLKLVDKMIKEREGESYFWQRLPLIVAVSLLQLVMCCCSLHYKYFCDNRDYQKNVESSGTSTRRTFRGLFQGSTSRCCLCRVRHMTTRRGHFLHLSEDLNVSQWFVEEVLSLRELTCRASTPVPVGTYYNMGIVRLPVPNRWSFCPRASDHNTQHPEVPRNWWGA